MIQTHPFHLVDINATGSALTVQWRAAPGAHVRPVAAETVAIIDKQVVVLAKAERRAGLSRDVERLSSSVPAGPGLEVAQRALGETLYQLLDGPDRALTRRLEDTRRDGTPLHLVVRLRTTDRKSLARHPSLGWHFQLLASAQEGPLALVPAPAVTIAVQLGDTEVAKSEKVSGGRLQVLFMAYSPKDVQPVLDYEGEEERILTELAPFVEQRRLVLKVAEEGSVEELRRRLMDRVYDVVHLTGHGVMTDQGVRLVMEDSAGERDDVSAERLLRALRDGRRMPRLLVISSCHSAEHQGDVPSLAAELLEGGVPCVVGWTRPVFDEMATDAAEELYRRLCSGDLPTEAVARARRELHREGQRRSGPVHAWATLELLARQVPGFAIDPDETPVRDLVAPGVTYRMLGSRMRVLTEGFVGRRRELQVLGRILRHGRWSRKGEVERPIAGALVVGMKGQGKSCLVGRAIDRHQQDAGDLSVVVLHGVLDEVQLLEAFRTEAVRLGDDAAEAMLTDGDRKTLKRIERLLRHHWRDRRLMIVLDDFEQNLEIPGVGDALPSPLAADLLEVLLPVCRDERPKLLVTATARFALPSPIDGLLAEIPLGALEGASVRKLWARGRDAELVVLGPEAWHDLCERFGRNARILDWARQLLGGKTPDEVRRVMAAASKALPVWKGQPLDEEKQDELVAAFLRHMAFDDAQQKVGSDAMTFIDRARVYEVPVPIVAFAGLTQGLAISLERHVPALANLGLLEIGAEECGATYRVSPLVKGTFDALDGEKWHEIAAEHWWISSRQKEGSQSTPLVLQSWEHALAARRQDLADQACDVLAPWFDSQGVYAYSAALGVRHLAAFPESAAGLDWAGHALFRSGKLRAGRALLERGVELAATISSGIERLVGVIGSLACVLYAQGDFDGAQRLLKHRLKIQENMHGTEARLGVAVSLYELGRVLRAQGNFVGARALLERSLEIQEKVYGTETHPEVAASLHAVGGVLRAQGDLTGARERLERALEIQARVYGTEEHPGVAASLHELARVLHTQGDLAGARALLERSLEIKAKIHGTEEHPEVAASLHELARVLRAQGDLAEARVLLERSLEIKARVYGTEEHPAVAVSLHVLAEVFHEEGDLVGARLQLERSLEIQSKVHGTEEHPEVATSLDALARVLHEQGDLDGARVQRERSREIRARLSHNAQ